MRRSCWRRGNCRDRPLMAVGNVGPVGEGLLSHAPCQGLIRTDSLFRRVAGRVDFRNFAVGTRFGGYRYARWSNDFSLGGIGIAGRFMLRRAVRTPSRSFRGVVFIVVAFPSGGTFSSVADPRSPLTEAGHELALALSDQRERTRHHRLHQALTSQGRLARTCPQSRRAVRVDRRALLRHRGIAGVAGDALSVHPAL